MKRQPAIKTTSLKEYLDLVPWDLESYEKTVAELFELLKIDITTLSDDEKNIHHDKLVKSMQAKKEATQQFQTHLKNYFNERFR